MSQDEIAVMDGGKCILQLRGVRPFLSEKFDIAKHPRYKYLAGADKKNTFDVDRFLTITRRKRQQVVTQDEVCWKDTGRTIRGQMPMCHKETK